MAALLRAAPWTLRLLGISGVGAAAAVASAEDPAERARSLVYIPLRVSRSVVCGAACVTDYQWHMRGLPMDSPERKAERELAHKRCADRVVQLCFQNGGVYIKAGQHLGQMDHLLPATYVRTLRASLLDRCPVSPPAEVAATITNDLGAPPEQLFRSFDPDPIASASLAQVHRAVALDGRQLAVKVQHAGLRESGAADVATIGTAAKALAWAVPDYDYSWVATETAINLPLELDFEHEAANVRRCEANLEDPACRVAGRVTVPQVLPELTSKRVLTMTYEEGVSVNNMEGLDAMGVDKRELAELIAETFSDMIFRAGYVHCDPHAANMLVRRVGGRAVPSPSSSPALSSGSSAPATSAVVDKSFISEHYQQQQCHQSGRRGGSIRKGDLELVLLDHGLYKGLDAGFQLRYAQLWKALVTADEGGIRAAAAQLGAGESAELFAGILTQRPFSEIVRGSPDHLRVGAGGEEEREQLADMAQRYARDAARLMQRMPRELLLLLKTNDCLRSVDRELGQPVNSFYITARACSRALAHARSQAAPGISTSVGNAVERLRLEWRLGLFSIAASLLLLKDRLQAQAAHALAVLGLATPPNPKRPSDANVPAGLLPS